ncbi:MAG TPA: FeoA family protein [Phycisphaerae bacterium]|jgi:ferrous iron transport protein A
MSDDPLTLDRLPIGQRGTILRLDSSLVGHRLMEMGLVPGTVLTVVRLAPLGDPIDVAVRGYHLSLRKSEARGVWIDPTTVSGSAT